MNFFIFILRNILGLGTREELLRGCLAGDLQEVRRFVDTFTPLIRARARQVLFGARGGYGRLVSQQDLDDLVQSTFEVLFKDGARTLRNFDPSRGMSLDGYVGQIAQREAHNFMDRRRADKRGGGQSEVPLDAGDALPLQVPSSLPGPDQQLESQGTLVALQSALFERLSEKGQLFFRLMFVEELETEEIVQSLGVTRDVVYTWRRRILQAMEEVVKLQQVPSDLELQR